MKLGDYVTMQAEGDEVWFGEVVGLKDNALEVYFIERGDDNVWSYSDEWHEVPKASVLKHVETSAHSNVVCALKELGFRPLSEGTFVLLDEKGPVPVGDPAFDSVEDDFVGIHPEMVDFIVPDEEGEKFTFAKADNEFVRETHKAVRAFNGWNPVGEARRVKDFIDRMDGAACAQENARTRLGEGMSYTKPPN
jgi:hypothetical protein